MKALRRILLGGSTAVFLLFEAAMFYIIHISRADTFFDARYLSIIGAAAFAIVTLVFEMICAVADGLCASDILFDLRGGNLIRIAMLFTLVADYYMVGAAEVDNLKGVTVFLGTQLFIMLHILANDRSAGGRAANIICRILISAVAVAIGYAVLGDGMDRMALTSVIYYANLCTNALFAHRSGRGGGMLTLGLILFALCDINVGIAGLKEIYSDGFKEGSLLYWIANADIDLIWLFYIPSQTLIPLSILLFNKRAEK